MIVYKYSIRETTVFKHNAERFNTSIKPGACASESLKVMTDCLKYN